MPIHWQNSQPLDNHYGLDMTPDRLQRLRATLDRRQPDLTVLLDNVHKAHNLSAILRTCDATGVLATHAVTDRVSLRAHHDVSSGSGKWVEIHSHPDLETAVGTLRAQGMQLLAAHLSKQAVDFRAIDYTRPTAILLGAELEGVSPQALAYADEHIIVPMYGLVASLNVSVAAAVILFEAQRQRHNAGLYERCRLDQATYERLLFEWAYPELATFYRRKGVAYPALSPDGDIVEADEHRRARGSDRIVS
jgi:tRNA (guanosine-2'-O-)-methyltransferase